MRNPSQIPTPEAAGVAPVSVMALRHDMTAQQRKTIALQSLERAVTTLEILGEDIADVSVTGRLDEVETRLTRLRFRFRMHQGLVHLAGVFGRAP